MKKIFVLHSSITEKIAISIINKRQLEDFIFITTARYRTERGGHNLNQIFRLDAIGVNLLSTWAGIFRGDRRVSEISGGPFHLYVPNTALEKIRLLLSHRQCEGFSVMEEGLYSYCSRAQLEEMLPLGRESLRERFTHFGRLGDQRFCRDGYSNLFALTSDAFPGRAGKNILSVEFSESQGSVFPGQDIREDHCILICESLSYLHREKTSVYVASFVEVLQIASTRYEKIHYKLHPDSYGTWQETLLRNLIHRHASAAEEIDRSASIEDIAIGSSADVLVNISSAGLYCGLYSEGDVYSFHDIFSSNGRGVGIYEEEGRGAHDWVPDIFWDNVTCLKNGRR